MKALIVYAHPEPTSFTAALKDTAVKALTKEGHTVEVSDLYMEEFNPVAGRHDFKSVLDSERFHYQSEQEYAHQVNGFSDELIREQNRLKNADFLIFVFPIWWGGLPAILKGWVDRVLSYGFAYVDGYRYDSGLFNGTKGLICLTTGGTEQRFSSGEKGLYGEIAQVLYPINHCIIKYFGLELIDPFIAYATPRLNYEERKKYLVEWENKVLNLADEFQHEASNANSFTTLPVNLSTVKNGWSRKN